MGNSLPSPKTEKVTSRGNVYHHEEGEETKNVTDARRFQFSLSTCQGWRMNQEDAYFCENRFIRKNQDTSEQCHGHSTQQDKQKDMDDHDCSVIMLKNHAIFGILDGHGGDYASKFVQKNFYSVFCKQSEYLAYCDLFVEMYPMDDDDDEMDNRNVQKSGKPRTKNRKKTAATRKKVQKKMTEEQFCTESSQLLQLALEKTFLQLDCLLLISMKAEMQHLNKKDESESTIGWEATENGYELMDAGTAVLIVIITPHLIMCANAGDCRAVLLGCGENSKSRVDDKCAVNKGQNEHEVDDDFKVIPLSVDHKPYLLQEQERILKAGATVCGGKIDGVLSLSRGLGDFNFKVQDDILAKDISTKHVVSPLPEIIIKKRNHNKDLYILGASDGIWDVISNEESADIVSTIFREGESDMGLVTEEVIDICLKKGSRDNMTVLVVKFPLQMVGHGGWVLKRRKRRQAKEMGVIQK